MNCYLTLTAIKILGTSSIESMDVSGKLTLGNKIGCGGYSDVYQGSLQNESCVVKVAVKELRIPPHLQGERFRKHFLRELKVWCGLEHPNIVCLLGYTIESGAFPRFVSRWCENGDLQQYILSNPSVDRFKLLVDVLQGMLYLESRGLVHGDLKSANVLIDEHGNARLCDFGATRLLEGVTGLTTSNQNAKATRRFISPERLTEDKPPTIASDIWAFGCVVIEVLTNRLPYAHFTSEHLVYTKILAGISPLDPSYDTSVAPGPMFWAFIHRCWRLKPEHRPTLDQLLNHFDTPLSDDMRDDEPLVGTYSFGDTYKRLNNTIQDVSRIRIGPGPAPPLDINYPVWRAAAKR
ncbi:hypothetical protein FRC02_003879 [Tulasnella sp. 418]|nr:hypothetical protein FRC02_003879 [Tulasnella sp. 418]